MRDAHSLTNIFINNQYFPRKIEDIKVIRILTFNFESVGRKNKMLLIYQTFASSTTLSLQACSLIVGSWTKAGQELDIQNLGGRNTTSVKMVV